MKPDDDVFNAVLVRLRNGDFSLLAPHFAADQEPNGRSKVIGWFEQGLFENYPSEAAEALTCACFLGERETAEFLIRSGLDPLGGSKSGMNAIHWAANRGELSTVRLLLDHRVPLEVRNNYGSTVLGQTVWSAVSQPRNGQL
jgi:ankyrin repeat protein